MVLAKGCPLIQSLKLPARQGPSRTNDGGFFQKNQRLLESVSKDSLRFIGLPRFPNIPLAMKIHCTSLGQTVIIEERHSLYAWLVDSISFPAIYVQLRDARDRLMPRGRMVVFVMRSSLSTKVALVTTPAPDPGRYARLDYQGCQRIGRVEEH